MLRPIGFELFLFFSNRLGCIVSLLISAALTLLLFVSCGGLHIGASTQKPLELSNDDRARFGDRVLRVPQSGGAPLIFGLDNCTLYKARIDGDRIAGWNVVLASDWGQSSYPKWLTGCTSQTMHYDGKYVKVSFCAQAFGAGGGCAGGGGTYRSRTGDPQSWQIVSDDGWQKL